VPGKTVRAPEGVGVQPVAFNCAALRAVPYVMAAGVAHEITGTACQAVVENEKETEGFVMAGNPKLAPLFN